MSQRIEVILDERGRIALPSPLQRKLGVTPGTTLVVEREKDAVYLRVQKAEEPCLVDKQGVLVVRARPFGDLANVVRDERGYGARRTRLDESMGEGTIRHIHPDGGDGGSPSSS